MSVNIYETPIKPSVNLEDGVTVYVPGYSYYGPDEPTLCTSLSEFEGLFGSSPYIFEKDQTGTDLQLKVAKGSPEKGYLYARSLLEYGLKVIFHRFVSNTNKKKVPFSTITITYDGKTFALGVVSQYYGPSYSGISVKLKRIEGALYELEIRDKSDTVLYSDTISFNPNSSIYIGTVKLPYIKFVNREIRKIQVDEEGSSTEKELIIDHPLEDSVMDSIAKAESITLSQSTPTTNDDNGEIKVTLNYTYGTESEFDVSTMLNSIKIQTSEGLLYPLTDFERYPSVTYLTTGGYYISKDVGSSLIYFAEKIKAIALIDMYYGDNGVNSQTDWKNFRDLNLTGLTGSSIAKGKAALFLGCNSFNVSPYRTLLGDSFNYLTCLGVNIKSGIKDWIPVANDPNGVSPLGYDTTQRISTELAETISESKIGISANAIIYSQSAGGYKIMGNRTLVSNDGVLSPNSFLNVSVVVNKVERAARQIANKLKIVSTDPVTTFNKFKIGLEKTTNPMVATQDGLISANVRRLPKTQPATIDIEIHLVVVEGIETFNIYIPYQISLD